MASTPWASWAGACSYWDDDEASSDDDWVQCVWGPEQPKRHRTQRRTQTRRRHLQTATQQQSFEQQQAQQGNPLPSSSSSSTTTITDDAFSIHFHLIKKKNKTRKNWSNDDDKCPQFFSPAVLQQEQEQFHNNQHSNLTNKCASLPLDQVVIGRCHDQENHTSDSFSSFESSTGNHSAAATLLQNHHHQCSHWAEHCQDPTRFVPYDPTCTIAWDSLYHQPTLYGRCYFSDERNGESSDKDDVTTSHSRKVDPLHFPNQDVTTTTTNTNTKNQQPKGICAWSRENCLELLLPERQRQQQQQPTVVSSSSTLRRDDVAWIPNDPSCTADRVPIGACCTSSSSSAEEGHRRPPGEDVLFCSVSAENCGNDSSSAQTTRSTTMQYHSHAFVRDTWGIACFLQESQSSPQSSSRQLVSRPETNQPPPATSSRNKYSGTDDDYDSPLQIPKHNLRRNTSNPLLVLPQPEETPSLTNHPNTHPVLDSGVAKTMEPSSRGWRRNEMRGVIGMLVGFLVGTIIGMLCFYIAYKSLQDIIWNTTFLVTTASSRTAVIDDDDDEAIILPEYQQQSPPTPQSTTALRVAPYHHQNNSENQPPASSSRPSLRRHEQDHYDHSILVRRGAGGGTASGDAAGDWYFSWLPLGS